MKRILPIVGCVPIALITSLAFSAAASPAASSRHKTITCPFLKAGRLTFDVPAKLGDLPEIDFDYPAKATLFSFRDGDLLLVAMDEGEPSRVRIVVSAQLNKKSGTYDGQIVVDMGRQPIDAAQRPGALHDCPRITVELSRGSGKLTARGRKNLMMQRRKEK